MVTPDKKKIKKHFYEIPANINELTDAQIRAWAEKVWDQFTLPTMEEMSEEEEGGGKS